MISKKNIQLAKKYLEYRVSVDQISEASAKREETHLRYVLRWAQETSFQKVEELRPTFPEYFQAHPLSERKKPLSPVYIKKTLATARLFFSWLHENEPGYKKLKPAWIKKIKVKRLANVPRTTEYVTFEEIQAIAARPARSARARRARAALVFLYLSGMRISAFISLPIQAVDIRKRVIYQDPSLGVRTKNNKYGVTYLLEIPELLQVVQAWDDEVRAILPPSGFWFAPLSFVTGQIDPSIEEIGKHRFNLARRDFRDWLAHENLPYHSPHKFRHGHVHYGLAHARTVADMKAVSLNVMHTDIQTTDQFYSAFKGEEIKNRISSFGKTASPDDNQDLVTLLEETLKRLKGG